MGDGEQRQARKRIEKGLNYPIVGRRTQYKWTYCTERYPYLPGSQDQPPDPDPPDPDPPDPEPPEPEPPEPEPPEPAPPEPELVANPSIPW
jgi:hypothetical protein